MTASEVMVFGTGVWEACDEEANPLYYGKYVSIGAGATSIASGHLSVSDTKTIWSISGDNKEQKEKIINGKKYQSLQYETKL